MFPSAKALQIHEHLGLTKLLTEAARERKVKIRLLVGRDDEVQTETEKLRRNWKTMDIHGVQTMLLVIIVDKTVSLAIELKKMQWKKICMTQ